RHRITTENRTLIDRTPKIRLLASTLCPATATATSHGIAESLLSDTIAPRSLRSRSPMIEVSNLSKRYGEFTAVRDLSFNVRSGEVMGLVGPNGAGKTTTLRCATGIIPATLGSIRLGGIDLISDPVGAKQLMAFVPDEPRLFEYLTVSQHLNFVARIYGV